MPELLANGRVRCSAQSACVHSDSRRSAASEGSAHSASVGDSTCATTGSALVAACRESAPTPAGCTRRNMHQVRVAANEVPVTVSTDWRSTVSSGCTLAIVGVGSTSIDSCCARGRASSGVGVVIQLRPASKVTATGRKIEPAPAKSSDSSAVQLAAPAAPVPLVAGSVKPSVTALAYVSDVSLPSSAAGTAGCGTVDAHTSRVSDCTCAGMTRRPMRQNTAPSDEVADAAAAVEPMANASPVTVRRTGTRSEVMSGAIAASVGCGTYCTVSELPYSYSLFDTCSAMASGVERMRMNSEMASVGSAGATHRMSVELTNVARTTDDAFAPVSESSGLAPPMSTPNLHSRRGDCTKCAPVTCSTAPPAKRTRAGRTAASAAFGP